jgi:mono/diheme cytochrome c family protein
MLYSIFGLPIFLLAWIFVLYVANCGLSASCSQASLPGIIHTPIPTLIPATLTVQEVSLPLGAGNKCSASALVLLSTWVNNGYSETNPFQFTDSKGKSCQATFKDIQPLFQEANLWYSGSLACVQCHNSDIAKASANMDLSSYQGILAGGKRTSPDVKGEDILGGGNWDKSILNDMLFIAKKMPFGRPAGAVPDDGPTIQAGVLVSSTASITETPSAEAIARPSNPGGPGDAVNLTGDAKAGQDVYVANCQTCHGDQGTDNVSNPGSDDGTVPALNPIDSTLVSSDYKTYATNLDLFIENGSVPAGSGPVHTMPAWGKDGTLSQQQIADVIAYIISLNH